MALKQLHKNTCGMSGKDAQVLSFTSCSAVPSETEEFDVDFWFVKVPFISKHPFLFYIHLLSTHVKP